jgi:hypothetical protein
MTLINPFNCNRNPWAKRMDNIESHPMQSNIYLYLLINSNLDIYRLITAIQLESYSPLPL